MDNSNRFLFIISATFLLYLLCACSVHSTDQKKSPLLFRRPAANTAQKRRPAQQQAQINSSPHHDQDHNQNQQHSPSAQIENNKNSVSANEEQLPAQNVRIIIPNLPTSHYQFWLKNHPRAFKIFEEICSQAPKPIWNISDQNLFQQLNMNLSFEDVTYLNNFNYAKMTLDLICSKIGVIRNSCWGYENNCQEIYLMPECSGDSYSEHEQKKTWFMQADFGYVLERRKELSKYCSAGKRANRSEVSSLECTKKFTTCRGDSLLIQFNPPPPTPLENNTRPDLQEGDKLIGIGKIGGYKYCDLQKARIREEAHRGGRLESWFGELANYDRLEGNIKCDMTFDKQVFFVKMDSTDNFHDYLGTFINLYATIHLNNRFSSDNQIVIWDEQLPRNSMSEAMWQVFSQHEPKHIGEFTGKKVCFDKFIFAMPPKIIDGLLNREALIEKCSKSGLFDAFYKHLIHRLKIPNTYSYNSHLQTKNNLVRVAIMSKSNSEIGRIVNRDELEQKIRNESGKFYVQHIEYDSTPLFYVLSYVFNSDIIIGLHDPGLSYALFAPEWGALIELDNLGKARYNNLARLRGLSYFRQDNHESNMVKKEKVVPESKQNAHLNSTDPLDQSDYSVNVEQFMKLFRKARDKVVSDRGNYFNKLNELARVDSAQIEAKQESTIADKGIGGGSGGSTTSSTTSTTTTSTTTSTTTTTTTTTSTTTSTTTTTTTTPAPSQVEDSKDRHDVRDEQETSTSASHTEL